MSEAGPCAQQAHREPLEAVQRRREAEAEHLREKARPAPGPSQGARFCRCCCARKRHLLTASVRASPQPYGAALPARRRLPRQAVSTALLVHEAIAETQARPCVACFATRARAGPVAVVNTVSSVAGGHVLSRSSATPPAALHHRRRSKSGMPSSSASGQSSGTAGRATRGCSRRLRCSGGVSSSRSSLSAAPQTPTADDEEPPPGPRRRLPRQRRQELGWAIVARG